MRPSDVPGVLSVQEVPSEEVKMEDASQTLFVIAVALYIDYLMS